MKLGHVHLKVRDLNVSVAFYQRLLGARQTESIGNHFSFLSTGKSHHDLALQALGSNAALPDYNMVGLYHSAFEVEDEKELLDSIIALEELGLEYSMVDHSISWAVYTSDPDGNGVEIYLDRRHQTGGTEFWHGNSRNLTRQDILRGISNKN